MSRLATIVALGVTLGVALGTGACSVEKLAPLHMWHRGQVTQSHRLIVLPIECTASKTVTSTEDPMAWCDGLRSIVSSELSFRGAEIVNLEDMPVENRRREEVHVTLEENGQTQSDKRNVTVSGAMFSEADAWLQRAGIEKMGVDTIVRVRVAQTATWPVRTLALIRLTRPSDAALINASVCELETSRIDSDQQTSETAVRCALENLK